MRVQIIGIVISLILICSSIVVAEEEKDITPSVFNLTSPPERIAFGSCNDQALPQVLWPTIAWRNPDLWIWMGDAIYGDYNDYWDWRSYIPPFHFHRQATPSILEQKYTKQLLNTNYASLREFVPVIGVWDDHDYGTNDGDKLYAFRYESQQLFLDFIGEPKDSPRRTQPGVYQAYTIGPETQQVKIYLLDVRYNKDPYGTKDGDFLGPEQWKWLESEIQSSNAAFNVIISSIQILPEDRFYGGESWGRFPAERKHLLSLILNSKLKGVILLSGDVHIGEINQVHCNAYSTILTEITSSGITHTLSYPRLHFIPGYIYSLVFYVASKILPWEYRPQPDAYYGKRNFGEISFDWKSESVPIARVGVLGGEGDAVLEYNILSIPITTTAIVQSDEPDDIVSTCRPINEVPYPWLMACRFALLGIVGLILSSIPVSLLCFLSILYYVYKQVYIYITTRPLPATATGEPKYRKIT